MTTLPCGRRPAGLTWLLKTSLKRVSRSDSFPSSTRRTAMQDSDMFTVMSGGKDWSVRAMQTGGGLEPILMKACFSGHVRQTRSFGLTDMEALVLS